MRTPPEHENLDLGRMNDLDLPALLLLLCVFDKMSDVSSVENSIDSFPRRFHVIDPDPTIITVDRH